VIGQATLDVNDQHNLDGWAFANTGRARQTGGMTVSRMTAYAWQCPRCGNSQEAPAWRILDARERPDVLAQLTPGLVFVVCPACGTEAAIEASMLLVRPGNELGLLLAIAVGQLAELSPLTGQELAHEAKEAYGREPDGVVGPMLPLPRLLLPLVLSRDVIADAASPEGAYQQVVASDATLAGWYRAFLQVVHDSEPERRVGLALQQLWRTEPDDLLDFLREHPELGSAAAQAIVARGPAADGPEEGSEMPQARHQLVEALANGQPVDEVAAEYLQALERIGRKINQRLEQLLTILQTNPGPDSIPQAREALGMAVDLGMDDLEAGLSAGLASRLLMTLVPDEENIEEAIRLLTRALSLLPDHDPRWPEWAGNLAAAYHRRITGDADENWEQARDLMERACAATDRAANPRLWATTETNYGLLLSERPGGSTAEDLNRGIEHLRLGLEERSPLTNPVDWAYSKVNLGLLYRRRRAGNDLRNAAECYREGLAHLRPEDHRPLWATLQTNLANVLLDFDPPDAKEARSAVQSVLEAIEPSADPNTYARALSVLGRIEEARHGRLSAEAITPRREALRLLTPPLTPEMYLRVGGELVDELSELGDWEAAADIYTGMLTAFDTLYDAQASAHGRRRIISNHPRLARWAAYALARAGQPERAVEAIENGRARQLSITVARDTADLARLETVDQQLVDRYRAAQTQYRAALADAAAVTTPAETQRIIAAERSVQLILQQIRAIPGFERFLQPMTVADIREAAEGHPVIYLVSAPPGSYVLTVSPSQPGWRDQRWRWRRGDRGRQRNQRRRTSGVDAVPVPRITSTDVVRLVLFDYIDNAPGLLLAQSTDRLRRLRLLPAALDRLGEMGPLAQPIADALTRNQGNAAIVIPTGLLGLIPLHAIPMPTDKGGLLDDIGEIHLAPSAGVYAGCRKRANVPTYLHLVGVADPQNSLPPLRGTRAELAAICSMFEPYVPAECAVGSKATRSWLLQHIDQASHLHLGCHGSSTLGDTSGGRLQLANDTELTMDDLIDGRLSRCRLAVGSACQSGHYNMAEAPDEFTGLPAGFLQAGAACAVVSLWQIDDRATAVLMTRFYELLDPCGTGAPVSPVTALRSARTWLRHLTTDQLNSFIQTHQPLADLFADRRAEPHLGDQGTYPYAKPQHWAAFTAWGE
jgi:CHAT domain-containing protein/tetratricopeptide (TPR) repeat protein